MPRRRSASAFLCEAPTRMRIPALVLSAAALPAFARAETFPAAHGLERTLVAREPLTTPFSRSSGPAQRLFQVPPAKSKFLAVTGAPGTSEGREALSANARLLPYQ